MELDDDFHDTIFTRFDKCLGVFHSWTQKTKNALDLLNEQLVKGELSEDEYDRLKREIREK